MLIEFIGNEAELADADRQKLEFVVSELLVAHIKGHHYAIFHRTTSKWMLSNLDLGKREMSALKRLSADFTQSAVLLNQVGLRVRIDPSHRSGIDQRGELIVVGLDDLQSNYFFDRAALVVEDQESDGQLFMAIADAARKKIRAPTVSLDIRHGGGERSKNVLIHLAKERRIALLVTDSDKAHPQKGKPAKVLRYIREVQETGWGLAWVENTPCRELENLVPLSIIETLPCRFEKSDDIAALASIDAHEKEVGCCPEESFWWYYDLKRGIDREKLENVSHDALRIWTKEKLDLAPSQYGGFGETIVSQLLGHSNSLASFLSHVRAPEWWESFGDLIKLILQFGFAPPIQRT